MMTARTATKWLATMSSPRWSRFPPPPRSCITSTFKTGPPSWSHFPTHRPPKGIGASWLSVTSWVPSKCSPSPTSWRNGRIRMPAVTPSSRAASARCCPPSSPFGSSSTRHQQRRTDGPCVLLLCLRSALAPDAEQTQQTDSVSQHPGQQRARKPDAAADENGEHRCHHRQCSVEPPCPRYQCLIDAAENDDAERVGHAEHETDRRQQQDRHHDAERDRQRQRGADERW